MDDDRSDLGAGGIDIFEFESFRQLIVKLDRGQCDIMAKRASDLNVDLGTVEGSLADCLIERHTHFLQNFTQFCFASFPKLIIAEVLLGIFRISE